MAASLNGQLFKHNVRSIHFESFNKECVTIKEAYGISVESGNKTKEC